MKRTFPYLAAPALFFGFLLTLSRITHAQPTQNPQQECNKLDYTFEESDAVNRYPYTVDALAVKSQAKWNAFWKKWKTDPPNLPLDFGRETVLLFPRHEWDKKKIYIVCQRHADVMVYYILRTGAGMNPGNKPTPPPAVDIYVIPKQDLPVKFTEKVITLN